MWKHYGRRVRAPCHPFPVLTLASGVSILHTQKNGTIAFPSSSHLAIAYAPLIGDDGDAAVGDGQGAAVQAAAVGALTGRKPL
jgi:hypothetical protein